MRIAAHLAGHELTLELSPGQLRAMWRRRRTGSATTGDTAEAIEAEQARLARAYDAQEAARQAEQLEELRADIRELAAEERHAAALDGLIARHLHRRSQQTAADRRLSNN